MSGSTGYTRPRCRPKRSSRCPSSTPRAWKRNPASPRSCPLCWGRNVADALQRVPAPAGLGMEHSRARRAGALLRRSGGHASLTPAGAGRAGAAEGTTGRTRVRTERGQNPHRAPPGRRRGCRFPRLPPPAGAQPGSSWNRQGIVFLARWPTSKAMQHARDRIRELTDRRRLLLSVEWIVQDINRFLRGWAAYFRYGNSARYFGKIMGYARMRLTGVIAKRHRRSRAFGWSVIAFQSPNYLGLINIDGTVAAPDPSGPGGKDRMPVVNDVGESRVRENCMHFTRRAGAGNGAPWPQTRRRTPQRGNRREISGSVTCRQKLPPRQSSTLHGDGGFPSGVGLCDLHPSTSQRLQRLGTWHQDHLEATTPALITTHHDHQPAEQLLTGVTMSQKRQQISFQLLAVSAA